MRYPALIVNKEKLTKNIEVMQKICDDYPVGFCAVTNGFCANPEIIDIYYEAGVREFADSRIQNLKKIKYPDVTKWLLRLPMLSEVEEVVQNADVSLNSELRTIVALSECAAALDKTHKIILMVDLGDLREGALPKEARRLAETILQCPNIELYGLGANFDSISGLQADAANVGVLADLANDILIRTGIAPPVLSGGGSGSAHLLTRFEVPGFVNNFRFGEVLLFGRETKYHQRIDSMNEDVFRLDMQIVELKNKPRTLSEEFDLNKYDTEIVFDETKHMTRAIVACGHQDAKAVSIKPLDPGIEIVGQSDDHTVLDVTGSEWEYHVGDIIRFSLSYDSLLSLSASEYVYKKCE